MCQATKGQLSSTRALCTCSIGCSCRCCETACVCCFPCLADYSMLNSTGPQLSLDPSYGPSPGFTSAFIGNTYLEEIHLTGHLMLASTSRWPAALATLPNLRVLHLSGPAAMGSLLPAEWSGMNQLRSLWMLNMTNVEGEGDWHGPGRAAQWLCVRKCQLVSLST